MPEQVGAQHQLGFKLKTDGRLLERFVEFLERAGAERITVELAVMWARLPKDAHPHRWRQRLGIVRGFARYLPHSTRPARCRRSICWRLLARASPHPSTHEEIRALMTAAKTLTRRCVPRRSGR